MKKKAIHMKFLNHSIGGNYIQSYSLKPLKGCKFAK